jgi:2'-5' RNA ligase
MKAFGSQQNEPPGMALAAGQVSQMDMQYPFSPGQPVGPYDGYGRTPRQMDFTTGYNIATRPRTHERVSFDTLRGLVDSYDVASICIWHKIDTLRGLKWKLIAADGYNGDVSGAVDLGMQVMRRPDRKHNFRSWFAKWFFDVLAYDAAPLFRLRNRAGKVTGLLPFDGTTLAPLLDYWGNSPSAVSPGDPEPEAYVQYVNGLPWNWLTRSDVIYEPFRAVNNSPYGKAPIESILLNANCYSDDTEVLTDRGWLRFAEVDVTSDRFATRNPATGAFEWQSATRYHEADSSGTMYRAASRNVDLLVTGGHRLLVSRLPQGCPGVRHGSEWLVHAEDLYEYQSSLPGGGAPVTCPATSAWHAADLEWFTLPVSLCDFVRMDGDAVRGARASAGFPACSLGITHPTLRRAERGDRLRRASAEAIRDAYGLPRSVIREDAHYFSERIEGDDFAAFMGMYLSEGCVRAHNSNISIAQEESSKGYVEFRDLLARMLGREAPYHRGAFTFGHTALADYLRPLGKAHEKYIPREVLGMSRRQLEIFWHFYVLGDGAVYPNTEIVSTCSKRLADGLQEVLQKIGYSSAVRPLGKPAKPTHHQQWQIQTRRKDAYRVRVEPVPYEGKVYCVSVPSKTLYVRRNGYPTWCANTDIRFQLYFLQRFTSGNVPEAFASAPEGWDPVQIEKFQGFWDSILYGDQSRKHQIRWMPGGAKIAWSNEKDFTDAFSLFMMRKTCACYHQVPTDLGFTETSNYSSGESQGDVQHKVGELPPMEYAEEIFSRFLYDDLCLPVQFQFDRGEDQDDRLNQAESDQIYIQNAVVSASEVREMRFGLGEAEGQVVPRIFFSTREGPIPLNALYGVSGKIDPATAAPDPGTPLPHEVFTTVQGVIPDPPLTATPLAAEEYGPKAIPPAPPMQQPAEPKATDPAHQVAKEGEGAATAGVTSETGLYSYDLDKGDDEDEQAVAKELAAFRRFEKARRKSGEWRDFRFGAVSAGEARRLNDEGRQPVAKADAPGLTPRSAMISLDLPDGLIGTVPGGVTDHHVTIVYLGPDVDEEALMQACERAGTAAAAMPGPLTGTVGGIGAFPPSAGSDGQVPAWAGVVLPGAEQLRAALEDLSASEHAEWHPHVTLAYVNPGDPLPPPVPETPVTFTHLSVHCGNDVGRFALGASPVAKAADAGPKGSWPGWALDGPVVAYWAAQMASTATSALPRQRLAELAASWLASDPPQGGAKRDRDQAAAGWLADHGVTIGLGTIAAGMLTDAFAAGAVSAAALVNGNSPDTAGWQPGDTSGATSLAAGLGLSDALGAVVGAAGGAAASVQAGYLAALGKTLTDGQDAGQGAPQIASAMSGVLSDQDRAASLAADQVTAASGQAAQAFYGASEVGEVVWLTESVNPCPVCQANADEGPVPTGTPFSSGDTNAPIHPNCACAVVPV